MGPFPEPISQKGHLFRHHMVSCTAKPPKLQQEGSVEVTRGDCNWLCSDEILPLLTERTGHLMTCP